MEEFHAQLIGVFGRIASAHPESSGWLNALPYFLEFAAIALVGDALWLGIVERKRRLFGPGVIERAGMLAEQHMVSDEQGRPALRQDDNGVWWKPKFDADTAQLKSWEVTTPPPGASAPKVNRATPGRFA